MTRRELIGMGSVAVIAAVLAGRIYLSQSASEASQGDFPFRRTDAQWRAMLSPESYRILREGRTEVPYSSALLEEHRLGVFVCAGCATPLFSSKSKYDSHTGWPSFWDVLPDAVVERQDFSLAMVRTEILCKTCGGHLGHVFDDGPKPTGLRYCMNGAAMKFLPEKA